ncbi:MAG: hypothetical protein AAFX50_15520, partial [Acidobacteriota bacterium]
MPAKRPSRRRFLGQASCSAVGATSLFSTLLNMRCSSALAAPSAITAAGPLPGDDYKALICLFLAGGNDSFNMLVPRGPAEYAEYAAVRGDLALPRESLLPISPATGDGREYGVHPGMPEVQQLFADGSLPEITPALSVGSTREPTLARKDSEPSAKSC